MTKRKVKKKIWKFQVTKILSYTTVIEIESPNLREARLLAKKFHQDGELRYSKDQLIIRKMSARRARQHRDLEDKHLEAGASKSESRDLNVQPFRVLLGFLLFMVVFAFGCGVTYEKPKPISFSGQYSWDGTRAIIEVAPPVSELDMNRFVGRRVTVTISGY